MDFKDYRIAVKRTLPDLGTVATNSIHCLLGAYSEIYELQEAEDNSDYVNIGEELTDIVWYISNYCNVRNINPVTTLDHDSDKYIDSVNFELNLGRIITALSELQNYDKKEWVYKKIETDEIRLRREKLVNTVINNLNFCYFFMNLNPEICMQNNIDKLLVRFPLEEGYSNERANSRNLENERKELEKE